MEVLANVIGVLGVIVLLIAYFLLQIGKISQNHFIYPFFNLIGSLMILCSLFYAWNLSAVIIEIAWAIISLVGIWRWKKNKNKLSHIAP